MIVDARRPAEEQNPVSVPPLEGEGATMMFWSWSDKDVIAGNLVNPSGAFDGIATYDLASRRYEIHTSRGNYPIWLSDGQRMIFQDGPSISILDVRTGETRKVSTMGPYEVTGASLSLPRDESAIYYSLDIEEADVWLLEME